MKYLFSHTMKHFRLIFCFSFLSLSCLAQKTDSVKNYKWEVGVQISSPQDFTVPIDNGPFNYVDQGGPNNSYRKDNSLITYGIQGLFQINDRTAIRAGIRSCNKKVITHHEDNFTQPIETQDETSRQNSVQCIFGLRKKIQIRYFTIYSGIDFLFNYFGNYKDDYSGYVVQASLGAWNEYAQINHPGGYSSGIDENFGIDISWFKHIIVGPEISDAILYEKTGGESIAVYSETGYYNFSDSVPLSYKVEKIGISKISYALNISYSF